MPYSVKFRILTSGFDLQHALTSLTGAHFASLTVDAHLCVIKTSGTSFEGDLLQLQGSRCRLRK
jgi:hypothetical protein